MYGLQGMACWQSKPETFACRHGVCMLYVPIYAQRLAQHFSRRMVKTKMCPLWFWEAWLEALGGAATY